MNKRDLLIEIGLEEMPARFVTDAINQFAEKVAKWMREHNISHGEVKKYSTPRRLTVLVTNVDEKQQDIQEEAKGPAKKIALDDNGNWSKAAIGFSRGQGASVEDIYFKEVNGVEYAFVEKFIKGQETKELLKGLKSLIEGLTFPKNMRWGSYDLRYARPIQWLLVMFGKEVIPFDITDIETSNVTYGHRFIGDKAVVSKPLMYEQVLLDQYVLADSDKRKQVIREQIKAIEEEKKWVIPVDEDLLEEVTNLVEYPTALHGTFEEDYLNLPEEVLITTMREHQRYFPVKDENGTLLPYFITVRNGNADHLENVARGNEKVLRARLSDANFFYEEDQKLSINDALQKLNKIVFHEELGTVGEKVERIIKLAKKLANRLHLSDQEMVYVERAAAISKFDLVTQLVYEFPELQGIMGEKYARIKGESEEVAVAINEHYMPRHAEDEAPTSTIGAIVGLADKLDTIAGFFSIGKIPSGSQDPYALRRQASGIVQTLIAKKWRIPLEELFELAIEPFNEGETLRENLLSFFQMRVKHVLQAEGIRYDVIDAVLDSSYHEVNAYVERAKVLEIELQKEEFKEVVEALSRVINISKKGECQEINPSLFQKDEEHSLYKSYLQLHEHYKPLALNGEFGRAFEQLKMLKDVINQYFDEIMVMAEDPAIRQNRLAQMAQLAAILTSFANLNTIIVK
ncbi:glycine--tRNA ligase subunit beta [Bacillus sp. FJAT-47783]|uniref:glycine--tRNA ligase subunit beta n=1 Tax=Bacillus sp. FJAT-47783 TaxID=2922712 RepID=UPI001FAE647E|nr:glycine--tRNA ligase subunit beta [Bacillus sp. FJAT-47783]